ncbi:MAG: PDZ domain-containing protein [Limisphaerales bacterium]
MMTLLRFLPLLVLLAGLAPQPVAAVDARLMRFPDVSATHIAFVYAGDIWVVPREGGTAVRLSSPRGEEQFPKFSPDGARLAFSANYDGNTDIYIMPVSGGVPERITFHGAVDRIIDWTPDGKSLLFASGRESERDRYNKLFLVPATGGLPQVLPLPYGEFAALNEDGRLLAYTPISTDFRTWKRYRGGMAPDIWLFDLGNYTARNLTQHPANDSLPMWHGRTLFFVSDRDAHQRNNLWSLDTRSGAVKQVTFFKDFDVQFPSIGPKEIVFTQADRLWLLDLATLQTRTVEVRVPTDRATLRPRQANVSGFVQNAHIAPNGKRIVVEARGDLFTAPREHGIVRSLTRSSGVAERYPTWSPDGKWIAYFSDRTGEYELTVRPEDGSGEEETLTQLGPGYRYFPQWSPDSKKIAFVDHAMRLWVYDFATRQTTQVEQMKFLYHGELQNYRVSWSADSRWLAFTRDLERGHTAVAIYDTRSNRVEQVTSGYYDDDQPVFDPTGKYLFFRSGRTFRPVYSDLDNTWIYPNTRNLFVVTLRTNTPSPHAPRNDEGLDRKAEDKQDDAKKEEPKKDDEKDGNSLAADSERSAPTHHVAASGTSTNAPAVRKKDGQPKPVEIDFAGFEARAEQLPVGNGGFDQLAAVTNRLLFRKTAATEDNEAGSLQFYDLDKRETKTITSGVSGFLVSARGDRLLVRAKGDYHIIEIKEGEKLEKKVNLASLPTIIEPMAEWRQLFTDAWRLQRDYFYDPNMHGVNWPAMRRHYERLLEQCVTRWDVNFVIGELIGELNSSHAYRSGGDVEQPAQIPVGYLGCDFALTNGAYQIRRILDGGPWDSEVRSPLRQPGLDIREGDYLLAVNGVPLDTNVEPWAAFQGLADTTVQLTVNRRPTRDGATNVFVRTLSSELRLRNLAWIEANRRRVEEASGGQIGYIYVPNTGRDGQSELVRQYQAQFRKPGLIIDERFNSGGQIPDRFVELIGRRPLAYWGVRWGQDWQSPPNAHNGAMAMLMNGWSGSGGDCFPYFFKQAGLGPLIGTRTWGGLIGITGSPPLVDGGGVSVPAFAIYDRNGNWIIEGEGVPPDIEVIDDPAEFARGRDPQLERAIAEVRKLLRANPPREVPRPKHPNRAGRVNELR